MKKIMLSCGLVIFLLCLCSASLVPAVELKKACASCQQLSQQLDVALKDFKVKTPNAKAANTRFREDLKKAAGLMQGMLKEKSVGTEELDAIALFMAKTADADGELFLLNQVYGEIKPVESKFLEAVHRLIKSKKISSKEHEALQVAFSLIDADEAD